MKTFFIILLLLSSAINALAQDPVFNQVDNSQLFLNPAFIGTNKNFSVDINYRNQWPELSANYKTTTFQINQALANGNGVGLHFANDNQSNLIQKSELGLGYGKTFHLTETHHLSFGIQMSWQRSALDYDKLTFGNMIDPRYGFTNQSTPTSSVNPIINNFDAHVGLMYYNKFLFAGYAVKHLLTPNESFFGGDAPWPMRHSFHLGGKLTAGDFTFVPTLRAFFQSSFNTAFATLKVKYKFIELDGGVQFDNGIFGGLGCRFDHFNFGYNYTASINNISSNISTHEIRLGVDLSLLKNDNKLCFDF